MEERFDEFAERMWKASAGVRDVLASAEDVETARESLYRYIDQQERATYEADCKIHSLEISNIHACCRVLRNILAPINEKKTGYSALKTLWLLANDRREEIGHTFKPGFFEEFERLFRGIEGRSGIYGDASDGEAIEPEYERMRGREAAEARTRVLDELGGGYLEHFSKYPSGLEAEVIERRERNKKRILDYFGGGEEDWSDYFWQIKHVIKTGEPLLELLELPDELNSAVKKAVENRLPFGVTPYYLSLMDDDPALGYDTTVRMQVIPPPDYVDCLVEQKENRAEAFDFMGEQDTSPRELITRRYPNIAILKPFNTCAQICVYCQRNWEIDEALDPNAQASRATILKAVDWFDKHPAVGDVLVTGGDPLLMRDGPLLDLIEELSKRDHIYRIRLGTRTPVVLPQRWSPEFVAKLAKYNEPGRRQVSIMTHFEHSYEITPEARDAVTEIRKAGMMVYNQLVYTFANSRRFENVKLRRDLKSIGVDPYYTFNTKGKKETRRYLLPIARLIQERKEEARLLPGLDRTDEPVFNVPRLGKNHLRSQQDHKIVTIKPGGARVYEFHPWEKNIHAVTPYLYEDVPIYDYLEAMRARGEDLEEYRTIYYYH
ncbi:MAG: KamA family radical SAM protein [Ignavibacteriales bacterium]|nr:KamA family radical SAM protein [Ignavibacteriales bacterium]